VRELVPILAEELSISSLEMLLRLLKEEMSLSQLVQRMGTRALNKVALAVV